ncbi:GTPase domain-containing protein [Legionella qingyii]|nr:GTPase domain-containing protein [Legionella qingyii]
MAKAKVQRSNNPPFQIMICGTNHSGKTTLCNALRGADSPGNIHTPSIDTYDTSIEEGTKIRLLDFAGSYDDVVSYLRQHYIEQSQICVVCIDRDNTNSYNIAEMAIKEIHKLDPDKKIVIALTKEDKYLKSRDYEILVKDSMLKKLEATYGIGASIKTSAAKKDVAELQTTLLKLREEVIAREERGMPNISSVEEYFPVEESLDEVIRRIHNLSALFDNAQIELTRQDALAKKESNAEAMEAINESMEVMSKFSKKLTDITKIPEEMKNAPDTEKRDAMLKEFEAAFNKYARDANSTLLTIPPPQNVKHFLFRLLRAPFIKLRMYTHEEKAEKERVKHQTDFKNRLQMEGDRYKEKNSNNDQQSGKKDDTAIDSSLS